MNRRSSIERAGFHATVGALALLVACAAAMSGCAGSVPLAEVGSSDAEVWVRVRTSAGEELTGELVSLDERALIVSLQYPVRGDVRVRGTGDDARLFAGTEPVEGDLDRVERADGGRTAFVHRTFRTADVASATFHEGAGVKSLRLIICLIIGPALGGRLGAR